jgi:hypothetical protein
MKFILFNFIQKCIQRIEIEKQAEQKKADAEKAAKNDIEETSGKYWWQKD